MPWTYKGKPVETLPPNAVGFLYLIITPEDRYYIGQTTKKHWKYYSGSGKDLKRYYAEHGTGGIRKIILMFFDCEVKLDKAEEHLIAKVNAKESPKYYNLQDGGKSNVNVSAKTKQRISKGKTGQKHSAETRAKMSRVKLGKVRSAEHCANIAKAKRGIPRSAETRAKLAKAQTGKKLSAETRAKMAIAQQARRKREKA